MISASASLPTETGRVWFALALPASLVLHVFVAVVLPHTRQAQRAEAPMLIEVIVPPDEEPPPRASPPDEPPPHEPPLHDAPPPREPPSREPPPRVAPTARPATAQTPASNQDTDARDRPADDAPVDFSSALMSNDAPGSSMASSGSGHGARRGPAAGTSVRGVLPAHDAVGPRVVPSRDLSRQPRAPGLDVELERHYPADARRAGISGKAVLRVMILADGRVAKVQRVEESRLGFGEACEATVRSARWEPPIDVHGVPVATEILYTCRFEIRG